MGLSAGRAFQGLNHHLLDLGIAYLAGRSWPGLAVESFQASFQKAGAPFAHHAQRGTHFSRHSFVIESFGASQHQACAPSQGRLATSTMGQRLQPIAFFIGQNQSLFGSPGSHLSLLHLRCTPANLDHIFLGQETSRLRKNSVWLLRRALTHGSDEYVKSRSPFQCLWVRSTALCRMTSFPERKSAGLGSTSTSGLMPMPSNSDPSGKYSRLALMPKTMPFSNL